MMAKVLCRFDDVKVMCKVIENMGYQEGDYVKAVEYEEVERIVIKRGSVWVPKPAPEKILLGKLNPPEGA